MGFSRQEYLSGLPCPPPEDLPNREIQPMTLMFPALAGRFFTTSATWEAPVIKHIHFKKIVWKAGRGLQPGRLGKRHRNVLRRYVRVHHRFCQCKRGRESKYNATLGIFPQLLSIVHIYCLVFLFQILVRKIFVLRKLCLFFNKQILSPSLTWTNT